MAESIVYIHGVPQSGRMWAPFVERTGGLAPDLPGFGFRRIGRMQGGDPETIDRLVEGFWPYFDHGTQRAILRLYRSAPEDVLAEAGRELGRIQAKTLVVWGADDPYLPTKFARAYADILRGELDIVDGAGHWPWLDRPEVVDRVTSFLAG